MPLAPPLQSHSPSLSQDKILLPTHLSLGCADQREAAWLLPAVHLCHSASPILCTLSLAKSPPGLSMASWATWLLLVASGEAMQLPCPSAAAGTGDSPHTPYGAQILSYFLSLVLHGHYPREGWARPGVCIGY